MMQTGRNPLFHFETIQSGPFKNLFEVLKDILHDVVITMSPQGLKIITPDGCKVTLTHVHLATANFEAYECRAPFEVGVNMTEVFKLVKQANLKDVLRWWVPQDDCHKLHIGITPREAGIGNLFKYQLLDMNATEMELPDVTFDLLLTMPSAYFHKLMKAMQDIGTTVTITYERQKLTMDCQGLKASQTVMVEDENLTAMSMGEDASFRATYPLKFLAMFSKAHTLCTTVEIMMKEGYPLVLKYDVGSLGEVKFCLANKCDSDSDDED